MNTLGTEIFVPISDGVLTSGAKYEVESCSSVPVSEGGLISGVSFKRSSTESNFRKLVWRTAYLN